MARQAPPAARAGGPSEVHGPGARSGLVAALREIVGPEAVLARPEDLLVYEADGLTVHGALPSAVVLPSDKTEVARVVRACRAHGVPFVPRGAGTGLSGGAIALDSGGRFYLAKDGLLTPEEWRRSLPAERLRRFADQKRKCDPDGRLQTDLARRVFPELFRTR